MSWNDPVLKDVNFLTKFRLNEIVIGKISLLLMGTLFRCKYYDKDVHYKNWILPHFIEDCSLNKNTVNPDLSELAGSSKNVEN